MFEHSINPGSSQLVRLRQLALNRNSAKTDLDQSTERYERCDGDYMEHLQKMRQFITKERAAGRKVSPEDIEDIFLLHFGYNHAALDRLKAMQRMLTENVGNIFCLLIGEHYDSEVPGKEFRFHLILGRIISGGLEIRQDPCYMPLPGLEENKGFITLPTESHYDSHLYPHVRLGRIGDNPDKERFEAEPCDENWSVQSALKYLLRISRSSCLFVDAAIAPESDIAAKAEALQANLEPIAIGRKLDIIPFKAAKVATEAIELLSKPPA